MDFPIHTLIDEAAAETWVLNHFHPEGLCCPKCQASVSGARHFRKTATSGLDVYRCKHRESLYNLYTGTVFAHTQFRPHRWCCFYAASVKVFRVHNLPVS